MADALTCVGRAQATLLFSMPVGLDVGMEAMSSDHIAVVGAN